MVVFFIIISKKILLLLLSHGFLLWQWIRKLFYDSIWKANPIDPRSWP